MAGEFQTTWNTGAAASQVGRFLQNTCFSTGVAIVLNAATNKIRVRLQAGGGGGGGVATAAVSGGGAGGGSAGGYAEKTFAVTPGGTYTYAVGTAGTASGAFASNGGVGGNTTFTVGGTTVTTVGGNGGIGITAAVAIDAIGGAAPAISTNGDLNATGAPGGPGASVSATVCLSGAGGSSLFGAGGNAFNTQNAGSPATGNGAGGSGGCCVNGGASVGGGAGTAGLICVDEYS